MSPGKSAKASKLNRDQAVAWAEGTSPSIPANRRLDWDIPDPKGLLLAEFRKVRDQIEKKVRGFLEGLDLPRLSALFQKPHCESAVQGLPSRHVRIVAPVRRAHPAIAPGSGVAIICWTHLF